MLIELNILIVACNYKSNTQDRMGLSDKNRQKNTRSNLLKTKLLLENQMNEI